MNKGNKSCESLATKFGEKHDYFFLDRKGLLL